MPLLGSRRFVGSSVRGRRSIQTFQHRFWPPTTPAMEFRPACWPIVPRSARPPWCPRPHLPQAKNQPLLRCSGRDSPLQATRGWRRPTCKQPQVEGLVGRGPRGTLSARSLRHSHPLRWVDSAANTVFSISMAMVIGPTPPGTGESHPAVSSTLG